MEGYLIYAIIAVIYSVLSYFITRKVVDFEKTKKFQQEMKELQDQFKKAHKENDIKKMEEINEKQLKKSKELPGLMKEQFKMSLVTLVLFFASLYAINHLDPNVADDVSFEVKSNVTLPLTEGLHIVSYEAKLSGNTLKGEFRYDPTNGKKVFEEQDLRIEVLPLPSEGKVIFSSNADVKLKDDMATRSELVLGNFRIYGIWLFILFSIPVGILLRKILPR